MNNDSVTINSYNKTNATSSSSTTTTTNDNNRILRELLAHVLGAVQRDPAPAIIYDKCKLDLLNVNTC